MHGRERALWINMENLLCCGVRAVPVWRYKARREKLPFVTALPIY